MNLIESLDLDEPPQGLSQPHRALWWLKKGDLKPGAEWEKAHAICQTAEGTPAYDRVHALAHWIEGDRSNSDYWYRRAGAGPGGSDVHAEWVHQAAEVGG